MAHDDSTQKWLSRTHLHGCGNDNVGHHIRDDAHGNDNVGRHIRDDGGGHNGGGCREFEQELKDQNRTWKQFFQDCFHFSMKKKQVTDFEDLDDYLKFTRLDLATDEMYSKKGNYDLRKLYDKMLV